MSEDVELPILSVHVKRPAIQVLARLKALLVDRGWVLVSPQASEEPHPLEASYVVLPGPRGGFTGVWPSVAEAHPEDFGAVLSSSLDADVREIVLGRAGTPFAYRHIESGRDIAKLGVVATVVAEREGEDEVTKAVLDGSSPVDALADQAEISDADRGWEEILEVHQGRKPRQRPRVLRFLPSLGDGDEEVRVDPLLECPECGSPMVERDSRHGTFFGCARFPDCRGSMTVKAAEAFRASHLE